MTLRILGKASSINVRKVLWACEEIGIAHTRADNGPELAQALLPVEPRARAEVDRWIDWQATEFNGAWRYAFSAIVRKNPAFHDVREIEASKKQWTSMVRILDRQLTRTDAYVAGAAFTLADIPIGLSVNRWFMTAMERPPLPAVSAYYERLSARPAFLRHGRNGIA
jgi:glutathione S-transferase